MNQTCNEKEIPCLVDEIDQLYELAGLISTETDLLMETLLPVLHLHNMEEDESGKDEIKHYASLVNRGNHLNVTLEHTCRKIVHILTNLRIHEGKYDEDTLKYTEWEFARGGLVETLAMTMQYIDQLYTLLEVLGKGLDYILLPATEEDNGADIEEITAVPAFDDTTIIKGRLMKVYRKLQYFRTNSTVNQD